MNKGLHFLLLLFLLLVCASNVVAKEFRMALPGYKFDFPRDFAAHEEYKTEWWYYTGHLYGQDNARYGFELTFFRIGMDIPEAVTNSWRVDNAYMAHFAISDFAKGKFFHRQKLNRAGVGFAGANSEKLSVFNQNWRVDLEQSSPTVKQVLKAVTPEYALDITLQSQKRPVRHGADGVSQKAACKGCASHYYSLTRLDVQGTVFVDGKAKPVKGVAWMDHEFGSNQLTAQQVGWDWFSIQIDDNTELMLYVMRRKDGTIDPFSSGTLVGVNGSTRHLSAKEYKINSLGHWKSNESGATYPMDWAVEVPSANLKLQITALLKQQELTKQGANDVTYWEGACDVRGTRDNRPITGRAYVEMTGYAAPFSANI